MSLNTDNNTITYEGNSFDFQYTKNGHMRIKGSTSKDDINIIINIIKDNNINIGTSIKSEKCAFNGEVLLLNKDHQDTFNNLFFNRKCLAKRKLEENNDEKVQKKRNTSSNQFSSNNKTLGDEVNTVEFSYINYKTSVQEEFENEEDSVEDVNNSEIKKERKTFKSNFKKKISKNNPPANETSVPEQNEETKPTFTNYRENNNESEENSPLIEIIRKPIIPFEENNNIDTKVDQFAGLNFDVSVDDLSDGLLSLNLKKYEADHRTEENNNNPKNNN